MSARRRPPAHSSHTRSPIPPLVVVASVLAVLSTVVAGMGPWRAFADPDEPQLVAASTIDEGDAPESSAVEPEGEAPESGASESAAVELEAPEPAEEPVAPPAAAPAPETEPAPDDDPEDVELLQQDQAAGLTPAAPGTPYKGVKTTPNARAIPIVLTQYLTGVNDQGQRTLTQFPAVDLDLTYTVFARQSSADVVDSAVYVGDDQGAVSTGNFGSSNATNTKAFTLPKSGPNAGSMVLWIQPPRANNGFADFVWVKPWYTISIASTKKVRTSFDVATECTMGGATQYWSEEAKASDTLPGFYIYAGTNAFEAAKQINCSVLFSAKPTVMLRLPPANVTNPFVAPGEVAKPKDFLLELGTWTGGDDTRGTETPGKVKLPAFTRRVDPTSETTLPSGERVVQVALPHEALWEGKWTSSVAEGTQETIWKYTETYRGDLAFAAYIKTPESKRWQYENTAWTCQSRPYGAPEAPWGEAKPLTTRSVLGKSGPGFYYPLDGQSDYNCVASVGARGTELIWTSKGAESASTIAAKGAVWTVTSPGMATTVVEDCVGTGQDIPGPWDPSCDQAIDTDPRAGFLSVRHLPPVGKYTVKETVNPTGYMPDAVPSLGKNWLEWTTDVGSLLNYGAFVHNPATWPNLLSFTARIGTVLDPEGHAITDPAILQQARQAITVGIEAKDKPFWNTDPNTDLTAEAVSGTGAATYVQTGGDGTAPMKWGGFDSGKPLQFTVSAASDSYLLDGGSCTYMWRDGLNDKQKWSAWKTSAAGIATGGDGKAGTVSFAKGEWYPAPSTDPTKYKGVSVPLNQWNCALTVQQLSPVWSGITVHHATPTIGVSPEKPVGDPSKITLALQGVTGQAPGETTEIPGQSAAGTGDTTGVKLQVRQSAASKPSNFRVAITGPASATFPMHQRVLTCTRPGFPADLRFAAEPDGVFYVPAGDGFAWDCTASCDVGAEIIVRHADVGQVPGTKFDVQVDAQIIGESTGGRSARDVKGLPTGTKALVAPSFRGPMSVAQFTATAKLDGYQTKEMTCSGTDAFGAPLESKTIPVDPKDPQRALTLSGVNQGETWDCTLMSDVFNPPQLELQLPNAGGLGTFVLVIVGLGSVAGGIALAGGAEFRGRRRR